MCFLSWHGQYVQVWSPACLPAHVFSGPSLGCLQYCTREREREEAREGEETFLSAALSICNDSSGLGLCPRWGERRRHLEVLLALSDHYLRWRSSLLLRPPGSLVALPFSSESRPTRGSAVGSTGGLRPLLETGGAGWAVGAAPSKGRASQPSQRRREEAEAGAIGHAHCHLLPPSPGSSGLAIAI